jgi:hypothetical protein
MAIGDIFQYPKGRTYALTWGDPSVKGKGGIIRATDLFFNYYFLATAFGSDGAARTVSVDGASYTMHREIGGAGKGVSRSSYTRKISPTYNGNGYAAGIPLYAIDGDDLWKFHISGHLEEFRTWVKGAAGLTNLKRPLAFKTATGVGTTATPVLTVNP